MGAVFTIGYEGADIDRFVRALKIAGVEQLADVRAVAVSRKVGFSKKKLAARLAQEDIRYFHFVSLGDPKPGRDAARAGKFGLFRSIYGAHIKTDKARNALRKLADIARIAPTCLLCFEREPENCHRTIVAREISKEMGFHIFNLSADGADHHVRNAAKLPCFHPGEGAAAA